MLSEEQVRRLVEAYLARDNANTRQTYEKQLEDYCTFAKASSPAIAILRLLKSGPTAADSKIERYKRSVVGVRDKKGQLISGRGLSPAAVNLRLTVLRSLVKRAHHAGMVNWQLQTANLPEELVNDMRGPGEDVLNRMLELAKGKIGPVGRRDYAILRLAGELGLRRKEIVGLDLADVDTDAAEIRISGKGRRQKETLSCTSKTADALQAWIEVRPRPQNGSPLFANLIPGRTGRISGEAVYVIIRRLGELALARNSKKRVSPHRVRHTAIIGAVHSTAALKLSREEVKKFSRHKDMRMVTRYLDEHDRAQAILAKAVGDRLK